MAYEPLDPPFELDPPLREYLLEELRRLALEMQFSEILELTAAPKKPFPRQIVVADGTYWNPGSGRGMYWYDSTVPSWKFLASATSGVVIASTAEAVAGTNNINIITPLRMREGFNAGGTAPVYACRAWVNFNGTGTVAIRASGNVSSITDNGVGLYVVNFTTALPDANYSFSGSTRRNDATTAARDFVFGYASATLQTASLLQIGVSDHAGTLYDTAYVHISVFR